eukprot:Rmarinus@m.14630
MQTPTKLPRPQAGGRIPTPRFKRASLPNVLDSPTSTLRPRTSDFDHVQPSPSPSRSSISGSSLHLSRTRSADAATAGEVSTLDLSGSSDRVSSPSLDPLVLELDLSGGNFSPLNSPLKATPRKGNTTPISPPRDKGRGKSRSLKVDTGESAGASMTSVGSGWTTPRGEPDLQHGRVRVGIRLRPHNAAEYGRFGESTAVAIDEEGRTCYMIDASLQKKQALFDWVFGPERRQEHVYEALAQPIVSNVLHGYNGTIIAYGQTGTGKTHTLACDVPHMEGISPRAVAEIFAHVDSDAQHEYTVSINYVQIYMERVYDLLQGDGEEKQLTLREDEDGVFLENVTVVPVISASECLQIVERGNANRAQANTLMNATSSRSHAVLSINVTRRKKLSRADVDTARSSPTPLVHGEQAFGKLMIVDLAGSERIKKTGAEGVRLEEAKQINKSLAALGNVIHALSEKVVGVVPYRNSKLTRLLQDSIGGNSKTALIVTIGPSPEHKQETKSSLLFAERAIKIKQQPRRRIQTDYKALSLQLQSQLDGKEDDIERLKVQLSKLRQQVESLQGSSDSERILREELAQLKRTYSAQSDDDAALKAQMAQDMQEIVTARENDLLELRRQHEAQMQQLRDEHESEVVTLRERHLEETERLRAEGVKEAQTVKNKAAAELESVRESHQNELEAVQEENNALTQALETKHTRELAVLRRECEEKVSRLERDLQTAQENYVAEIQALVEQHRKELEQCRLKGAADADAREAALHETHTNALALATEEKKDALRKLRRELEDQHDIAREKWEREAESIKRSSLNEVAAAKADLDAKLSEERSRHLKALDFERAAHKSVLDSITEELSAAKKSSDMARAAAEEEITRLQDALSRCRTELATSEASAHDERMKAKEDMRRAREEANRLQEEVDKATHALRVAESSAKDSLTALRRDLESKFDRERKEIETKESRKESSQREITALVSRLEEEIKKLREDNEGLRKSASMSEEKERRLRRESVVIADELERTKARSHGEVSDLTRSLEDVRASSLSRLAMLEKQLAQERQAGLDAVAHEREASRTALEQQKQAGRETVERERQASRDALEAEREACARKLRELRVALEKKYQHEVEEATGLKVEHERLSKRHVEDMQSMKHRLRVMRLRAERAENALKSQSNAKELIFQKLRTLLTARTTSLARFRAHMRWLQSIGGGSCTVSTCTAVTGAANAGISALSSAHGLAASVGSSLGTRGAPGRGSAPWTPARIGLRAAMKSAASPLRWGAKDRSALIASDSDDCASGGDQMKPSERNSSGKKACSSRPDDGVRPSDRRCARQKSANGSYNQGDGVGCDDEKDSGNNSPQVDNIVQFWMAVLSDLVASASDQAEMSAPGQEDENPRDLLSALGHALEAVAKLPSGPGRYDAESPDLRCTGQRPSDHGRQNGGHPKTGVKVGKQRVKLLQENSNELEKDSFLQNGDGNPGTMSQQHGRGSQTSITVLSASDPPLENTRSRNHVHICEAAGSDFGRLRCSALWRALYLNAAEVTCRNHQQSQPTVHGELRSGGEDNLSQSADIADALSDLHSAVSALLARTDCPTSRPTVPDSFPNPRPLDTSPSSFPDHGDDSPASPSREHSRSGGGGSALTWNASGPGPVLSASDKLASVLRDGCEAISRARAVHRCVRVAAPSTLSQWESGASFWSLRGPSVCSDAAAAFLLSHSTLHKIDCGTAHEHDLRPSDKDFSFPDPQTPARVSGSNNVSTPTADHRPDKNRTQSTALSVASLHVSWDGTENDHDLSPSLSPTHVRTPHTPPDRRARRERRTDPPQLLDISEHDSGNRMDYNNDGSASGATLPNLPNYSSISMSSELAASSAQSAWAAAARAGVDAEDTLRTGADRDADLDPESRSLMSFQSEGDSRECGSESVHTHTLSRSYSLPAYSPATSRKHNFSGADGQDGEFDLCDLVALVDDIGTRMEEFEAHCYDVHEVAAESSILLQVSLHLLHTFAEGFCRNFRAASFAESMVRMCAEERDAAVTGLSRLRSVMGVCEVSGADTEERLREAETELSQARLMLSQMQQQSLCESRADRAARVLQKALRRKQGRRSVSSLLSGAHDLRQSMMEQRASYEARVSMLERQLQALHQRPPSPTHNPASDGQERAARVIQRFVRNRRARSLSLSLIRMGLGKAETEHKRLLTYAASMRERDSARLRSDWEKAKRDAYDRSRDGAARLIQRSFRKWRTSCACVAMVRAASERVVLARTRLNDYMEAVQRREQIRQRAENKLRRREAAVRRIQSFLRQRRLKRDFALVREAAMKKSHSLEASAWRLRAALVLSAARLRRERAVERTCRRFLRLAQQRTQRSLHAQRTVIQCFTQTHASAGILLTRASLRSLEDVGGMLLRFFHIQTGSYLHATPEKKPPLFS